MLRIGILLGLVTMLPVSAQAAWQRASSDHFVIYADTTEAQIREFADRLERYHAAMAVVTKANVEKPSPSNRVTIYAVDDRDIGRLHGSRQQSIRGFYVPRAGGSMAIVGRLGQQNDFSQVILLHEYAHHFMHSSSNFPMPQWLSEGSAEFMAPSRFNRNGSVEIGHGVWYRAHELFDFELRRTSSTEVRDVTATELLESGRRSSGRADTFYSKSWLLYHYLTFDQERRGQLANYMNLLAQGKSSREAGEAAFGDLEKLNSDLIRYMRARGSLLEVPASRLNIGEISIERLNAGAAAIMPVRVQSKSGVNDEIAQQILPEARAVAARYPNDPEVLAALAEAEHDAGNHAEAVAAADAALALDPANTDAHVQKGLALYAIAGDAERDEVPAAYAKALAAFVALNKIENNHPLPLIYNYRIQVAQGDAPSELAVRGLARAAELAPFDLSLRMTLGLRQLANGDREAARANLMPVAYNPHGGGMAERAQQTLERMDSDPTWDGRGVEVPDEDEDDEEAGEEAVEESAR